MQIPGTPQSAFSPASAVQMSSSPGNAAGPWPWPNRDKPGKGKGKGSLEDQDWRGQSHLFQVQQWQMLAMSMFASVVYSLAMAKSPAVRETEMPVCRLWME